jgi:hypothetical protein
MWRLFSRQNSSLSAETPYLLRPAEKVRSWLAARRISEKASECWSRSYGGKLKLRRGTEQRKKWLSPDRV